MELKFEDPSPKSDRSTDPYEVELAQLVKLHPGKFVRLEKEFKPSTAAVVASSIRAGKRVSFGSGFHAESRTIEGKGVVYVKYVSDAS